MKKKKLKKEQKSKLRRASALAVEQHFVATPEAAKRSRWIAVGNRYREHCVKRYDADSKTNPPSVRATDLTAYVSASAPAHLIDGWSFLGRSVDSALRGDRPSTVFFAYYAELRAVMALLAAEGMGVFNMRHPVLLGGGTFELVKDIGTHDLSRLAFAHWAGLRRSTRLLSSMVSPRDISMTTWLQHLAPGFSTNALADKWLGLWGVDLKATEEDHNLRNQCSYRPSQFRRKESAPTEEVVDLVVKLWELLEPSRGARFPNLSRILLRRAIKAAGVHQVQASELDFTSMTSAEAQEWALFLSSADESEVLTYAAKQSGLDSSSGHLEVMCRAALLLAISSEASRKALASGSYDTETLRFWWAAHGIERGLWEADAVPDDPLDAWSDIYDAIQVTTAAAPPPTSIHALRAQYAPQVSVLGGFEVAGIWGLVP